MKLDRVTLTGADDSVEPGHVVELAEKYPFSEWGILMHGGPLGGNRFPSMMWIKSLLKIAPPTMNLCAHLCGIPVDRLMAGDFTFEESEIAPSFQRVQVNFHALRIEPHPHCVREIARAKHEMLFQVDGVNDAFVIAFADFGLGFPLFDLSGGAGELPPMWPVAWQGIYCGYAGGLGPDNTREQVLGPIKDAAGDERIWIDMETRVRSNRDKLFDLAKCEAVLESVKDIVSLA